MMRLGFRTEKVTGSKPRGQISIMIAIMLTVFVIFFAFVANVGLLVNAKINLQNAADMAAYAGAAVQARQLNQIGMLNYEMRRNYKRFLFRYYVMGNVAQYNFPVGKSGSPPPDAPYDWDPVDPAKIPYTPMPIGVPVVCVTFDDKNNFCKEHLPEIPTITAYGDAISKTLETMLKTIEELKEKDCVAVGERNKLLLSAWLYKADNHDLSNAASVSFPKPETLNFLTAGLGLIPRMILLGQRVRTLESFVNTPAHADPVNYAKIFSLQQGDAFTRTQNERTIQAFLSAWYTVGDSLRTSTDSLVMEELAPAGRLNPDTGLMQNYLSLRTVNVMFDTFAQDFEIKKTDPNKGRCLTFLSPFPVVFKSGSGEKGLAVGFVKEQQLLTYYGIKLRNEVKLPLSPFGPVHLEAFAAARPFGSRIGPYFPQTAAIADMAQEWHSPHVPSSTYETGCGKWLTGGGMLECAKSMPNLSVRTSDVATDPTSTQKIPPGGGWYNQKVLFEYYRAIKESSISTGSLDNISKEQVDLSQRVAMSTNPAELHRYLIATDEAESIKTKDPFMTYFPDKDTKSTPLMKIYAPLTPDGVKSDTAIKKALKTILSQLNIADPNTLGGGDIMLSKITAIVEAQLTGYVSSLASGLPGEDNEEFDSLVIRDPLVIPDPFLKSKLSSNIFTQSSKIMAIKDSWVTNKSMESDDPELSFGNTGRVGYSVKFTPFSQLITGSGGMTNVLDTVSQPDLGKLQH